MKIFTTKVVKNGEECRVIIGWEGDKIKGHLLRTVQEYIAFDEPYYFVTGTTGEEFKLYPSFGEVTFHKGETISEATFQRKLSSIIKAVVLMKELRKKREEMTKDWQGNETIIIT